jgi:hypothetical protein
MRDDGSCIAGIGNVALHPSPRFAGRDCRYQRALFRVDGDHGCARPHVVPARSGLFAGEKIKEANGE